MSGCRLLAPLTWRVGLIRVQRYVLAAPLRALVVIATADITLGLTATSLVISVVMYQSSSEDYLT
jgi:hypothetical protein